MKDERIEQIKKDYQFRSEGYASDICYLLQRIEDLELQKAKVEVSADSSGYLKAFPLEDKVRKLEANLSVAIETLKSLKETHHDECEDGFYSCPKADNYFDVNNDDLPPIEKRDCYCGMDKKNQRIEEALRRIKGGSREILD